jgi:protein-S-isoprenylcysteine O-methyltransferase Ste14
MTRVANAGFVRPPLVYLASLAVGLLLQWATPLPFVPPTLDAALGAALIGVAIALFACSVAKFRAADTPVPGDQPTTAIVRTGPYGFSRNPIYLAFSVFQLGVASWVNSLWLLATLAGAAALISVVIRREESYLQQKFGTEYLDYKRSVRRWL